MKNRFTIKDLSEGNCAVINDGAVEELNQVLFMAFPGCSIASGNYMFYLKSSGNWDSVDYTDLPTQSVGEFLKYDSDISANVLSFTQLIDNLINESKKLGLSCEINFKPIDKWLKS
jgi:hypothetical protein